MNLSFGDVKELLDPFFHTYVCQDKRPFYLVAPCHAIHQKRALQALGIWDEFDISTEDPWIETQEWKSRTVLGVYPLTDPELVARLKDRMSAAFLTKSASEWDIIFGEAKVPAAATLTTDEWLNSPHAIASGLVQERVDPSRGGVVVREAGPVVWFRDSSDGDMSSMEACKKRSREKMLRGKEEAKADMAVSCMGSRRWLAGVKVVDLCDVIAGPTMGRYLSRFGAEVIKVDPAKPKYDPLIAVLFGLPANRDKRSILVDVKSTPDGSEILRRLIEWADVVLVNQAAVQLPSLGLDDASVYAINPEVIIAHFDAFGGPTEIGPRSQFLGYDDNVQACTGVMARFGGGLETAEEHAHVGMIDVVSGFTGAL